MTQHYNKSTEKEKRRTLRKAIPPAEKLLWAKVRNKQLASCKFRRQYSVDQFVIDFYCPELKLAIEVDGSSHFKAGAADYDHARQTFIEQFGITFLRVTNTNVYENLSGVCDLIQQKISELRNRGASRFPE